MSGQTITKTLVDGLEPRPSEYTVWDAKLPGFGVRVRPTGAISFVVVYRAGTGRGAPSRRFTIAPVGKIAPDAARTQAKVLLGTIANGADPAAEKRAQRPKGDQLTFDELAQLYLDQYAKVRKSSWKNDEGYLKRPRAKWKRKLATEITDDDVAELLEEIGTEAPVSANRTQSILHTLFLWAKEPGRKHVKINPVADMRRRFQETPRERVLTDGEIKTLWWGLDDPALPASRPVDHLEGDVTATYDKYNMLKEKRAVATILEAELRRIVGSRPHSTAPENIFDQTNIVAFEEKMRVTG